MTADVATSIEFPFQLDIGKSMGRSGGKGLLGPVVYDGPVLWRAEDTADGAATLRIERRGRTASVQAWGDGAEIAAAKVPALLGALDDPSALVARDELVAGLLSRFARHRMTATGAIWEHVMPTIFGQKVTGVNARTAWQGSLRAWGRTPPGPAPDILRLAPSPDVVANLGYHEFHRFDVERRRANVAIECARRANRLEEAVDMEPVAARRRLEAINGIGPWTSSIITQLALGDPDAVVVGDYHLPSQVAWAMAGERTATDERMLELLEPYAGQRGRVQHLIKIGAPKPPRHGARMSLQDLSGR